MSLTGDNTAKFWASCPKVVGLGHRRRSSSSGLFNINITEPILSKYKHLAKLHSDSSVLGLNAVNKPGLPKGTLFRSSLPATPLTSPMYPSILHQFTEKAIQDLLGKSSTPKVVKKSSSDFELKSDLDNSQRIRTNLFDMPTDQNIITRSSLFRPQTLDLKHKINTLDKINENGKLEEKDDSETNKGSLSSFYYSIKEEQEENDIDCQPIEDRTKNNSTDKLCNKADQFKSSITNNSTVTNNLTNQATKNNTIETITLDDSTADRTVLEQNLENLSIRNKKVNEDHKQNGVKHDDEQQQNCLYVKNLHYNLRDEELRDYFCKFGSVIKSKIIFDHNSKTSKCFGFVTFSNKNDVQKVLRMPKDAFKLKNRTVQVSLARNKK